jgi:hypothetical protein
MVVVVVDENHPTGSFVSTRWILVVNYLISPHGSHDISCGRNEGIVLEPEQDCCGVCICGTTTIPSLMVDFEELDSVCS